jgi:hypothetical protein
MSPRNYTGLDEYIDLAGKIQTLKKGRILRCALFKSFEIVVLTTQPNLSSVCQL